MPVPIPLDVTRLHPDMKRCVDEAMKAMREGDAPKWGDMTMAAVHAAPNPWAYGRYYLLHQYGSALVRDRVFGFTHSIALESIISSREEPALFRALAGTFLAAGFGRLTIDEEVLMEHLTDVERAAEQADPDDAGRPLITPLHPGTTAGAELKHLVDSVEKCRRSLEENSSVGDFDWLMELLPETRFHDGGSECDCCGKTLEELGVASLHSCGRCKMAFYCSKDCQRLQWKAGHKKACREPRDVSVGDYMMIRGELRRQELNGRIVLVKGRHPTNDGRWTVELLGPGGGEEVSVLCWVLRRSRPTK